MTPARVRPAGAQYAFAAIGALLLSACDGSEPANVVTPVVDENRPGIDLAAYEKQRYDDGAVTLIDAALPDAVLMPPEHRGATFGEIKEAELARRRAARENDDARVAVTAPAVPAAPAPEPVLEVAPSIAE